jgi:hypothetical protein
MNETILRLFVLVGVIFVVSLVAWIGSRRHLARPEEAIRADLAPGIHLFSSSSCGSCAQARRVLTDVVGAGFVEIRFEDDPPGFGRFAIARVPTVIVVGNSGHATVFEGIPRRRDLKSVVRGA